MSYVTTFIKATLAMVGKEEFNYHLGRFSERDDAMASLAVTMKGQITLKRALLQHLGVKPGDRIDFDKLPGGELRVKAARPTGAIDSFIGRRASKVTKPMTIDDMNEIAASGWAGED